MIVSCQLMRSINERANVYFSLTLSLLPCVRNINGQSTMQHATVGDTRQFCQLAASLPIHGSHWKD